MNDLPEFRVEPLGLNIRSAPEVRASTRLAVLPRGHGVTGIGSADEEGWIMVSTELDGTELEGFVAKSYLKEIEEFDGEGATTGVTEVHLREGHPRSRRDRTGGRAFPIGEADRPERDPDGSRRQKIDDLVEIIDWLDVENSDRYQATGNSTFCNIYACDYCYLAEDMRPRI